MQRAAPDDQGVALAPPVSGQQPRAPSRITRQRSRGAAQRPSASRQPSSATSASSGLNILTAMWCATSVTSPGSPPYCAASCFGVTPSHIDSPSCRTWLRETPEPLDAAGALSDEEPPLSDAAGALEPVFEGELAPQPATRTAPSAAVSSRRARRQVS